MNSKCPCGEFWNSEPITKTVLEKNPATLTEKDLGKTLVYCGNGHGGLLVECCMCKKGFPEKTLDFLGRGDDCFRIYMDTPDSERPKLGVPFVPIYNGKDKYGF